MYITLVCGLIYLMSFDSDIKNTVLIDGTKGGAGEAESLDAKSDAL